ASDPEAAVDPQEDRDADAVVDELVEERRVERRLIEIARGPMFRTDLQPPRELRRLAEQLLVEPVPPAPDPLLQQEAGRDRVHEEPHALVRAAHHPGADQHPEEDSAPDAEAALPDRERTPPLVRHLAPAGDVVVEARADDSGRDAPDGDAED